MSTTSTLALSVHNHKFYRQTPNGWQVDVGRDTDGFKWRPVDLTTLPEQVQRKLSVLALVQLHKGQFSTYIAYVGHVYRGDYGSGKQVLEPDQ